VLYRMKSY